MEAGDKQANKEVKAVWGCKAENCDYTCPPTVKGYKQLVGHQKEHAHLPKEKRGYHLVDKSTGEVLARSIKEAEPFLMLAEAKAKEEAELALKEKAQQEAEAAHKAKEAEAKAKEEAEYQAVLWRDLLN